jgi:hypothetical protein
MNSLTEEAFWRFVCERQAIWHRREGLGLPPPWTEDPILAGFHFTNVYRDLDTGTKWLRALMDARKVKSCADAVWYSVVYRLINRIGTFEENFGPPCPDPSDLTLWLVRLRIHRAEGKPIFTSRHQCRSLESYEAATRLLLAPDVVNGQVVRSLANDIQDGGSGESAVRVLKSVPGIGDFFAYQVYLDLDDSGTLGFKDPKFVSIGPGSRAGLRRLFPGMRPKDMPAAMVVLADWHDMALDRLGLEFHRYNGMALRPRDVEHALCEFHKYCVIMEKNGERTGSKVLPSKAQLWWARRNGSS